MMCTKIVPEILRARKTINNINNKKTFIRQYIFPGPYAYFQM